MTFNAERVTVHWFQRDLRLRDNPALSDAAARGRILPVYVFDDKGGRDSIIGGASRWWLHHALTALRNALNNRLAVLRGDPCEIIVSLVRKYPVDHVVWNDCFEPLALQRGDELATALENMGVSYARFNAGLLFDPRQCVKANGEPYRVFTPFYRACQKQAPPREPLPLPRLDLFEGADLGPGIDTLRLLPDIRWDKKLAPRWEIGEQAAVKRLDTFLRLSLPNYAQGRDFPAQETVSHLSPHLHFGEISPHRVWHNVRAQGDDTNVEAFCRELMWREFSYHSLIHSPALPQKNSRRSFDRFPWRTDPDAYRAWCHGHTGYPLVDAGMRELWNTGYMHNRVRMIAGSFLVKNLMIDWRHGAGWFWDCLVDADLANNSCAWQWLAGCGADAAPYFRIFNPVTQAQKFDPHGHYIRHHLPELKRLPDKYLALPSSAPKEILMDVKIELGVDYPYPIVNLRDSRERALAAYRALTATAN